MSTYRPSRRDLLRGVTGAAATLGLGALTNVATDTPAHAYDVPPASWTITGDGWSGQLNFWKLIRHGDGSLGVLGDFSQTTPILAFQYGPSGLSFVRLLDPALQQFQVFRGDTTTLARGHFSTYTRNADGTYSHTAWSKGTWRITAFSGLPLSSLVIDDSVPVDGAYTITAASQYGQAVGQHHRLHAYNAPDTTRQFWGRCYSDAMVGFTHDDSRWAYIGTQYYDDNLDGVSDRKVKVYDMPYSFIRPLHTHFDRFQVFQGRATRLHYFRKGQWPQPTWLFDYAAYSQQGGSWSMIEPVAGNQYVYNNWWTNVRAVY